METRDVEEAVRHVLPALTLRPDQFHLDRGFLARAQRSVEPRALALNGLTEQFVFVGFRATTDPEADAQGLAAEALASLGSETRAACQRLVVGWTAPHDRVFAAVFDVSPDGTDGTLLASSWIPPDAWPEPMFDASKSGDDIIDDALARLEAVVRTRKDRGSDFDSEFERALRLVDKALLLYYDGESQRPSDHPSVNSPDRSWNTWLYYFNQSVLDEWNRIGDGVRRDLPRPPEPAPEGPLTGLRVFLSYARPDATTFAWCVHEALSSCGAKVWFDRTLTIDQRQLALGLSETIGSCDAYVMCASDEFFERSGYATQEFAWAAQHRASGGKLKHFLVVVRPGTILPSAVATWPTIEFRYSDRYYDSEEFANSLAANLRRPAQVRVTASPSAPLTAPLNVAPLPPLPRHADIPALWQRVQHIRLFDEIDIETLTEVATSTKKTRKAAEVRRRLMHLGDGLDWNGTLQDIDSWPDDSLVQDVRFRFASARAVAGTRWPLNDDLRWETGVANDVEYLVTHPVPVIDWPAVPGWDDGERRFSLRHHASLLRILQGLLHRGLWGGIMGLPSSTLDAWAKELSARRRECYDALLALRLNGRLSWQDVTTWLPLFRSWSNLLTTRGSWREPLPSEVLQVLVGYATEVAAIASNTGWYVSRNGSFASQSFKPRGFDFLAKVEVYALSPRGIDAEDAQSSENTLRIGLVARAEGDAELRVSWRGLDLPHDAPSGESSKTAPGQLRRAINAWKG